MKKLRISTVLFLLLMALVIWIDVPQNKKVGMSLAGKRIGITLNPPQIVLGKFKKEFITKFGLDIQGGSHLVFEADTKDIKASDKADAILSARDIIERRVNFFGVSEPSVYTLKSGTSDRIVVDLPGFENVAQAVGLIGKTAQLTFRELPGDGTKIATDTPIFLQLTKVSEASGKHIKKATMQFDRTTGKPVVSLAFSSEGTKLFAAVTKRNVGKPLGIFVDDVPITAPPIVQTEITDGNAIISGEFKVEDARALAVSINSGALPVSIKLVQQQNIGPSLGRQEVQKSVVAGVIGLSAVILFLIFYYGRLGIIASLALLIYGLISYATVKAIPVVLTLPGIAGFILSIGMAVDSNILIFERIREELRKGVSPAIAVTLGFGRAIDAIKDANITTLLVAFILFNPFNWSFFPQFGLVRGFALTLAIGVTTSLFTGIVITKRLIDMFYTPFIVKSMKSSK
ncbi:MAG: protein translocase subunit SecD [Candidatus Roizmanbacteria bacterium]